MNDGTGALAAAAAADAVVLIRPDDIEAGLTSRRSNGYHRLRSTDVVIVSAGDGCCRCVPPPTGEGSVDHRGVADVDPGVAVVGERDVNFNQKPEVDRRRPSTDDSKIAPVNGVDSSSRVPIGPTSFPVINRKHDIMATPASTSSTTGVGSDLGTSSGGQPRRQSADDSCGGGDGETAAAPPSEESLKRPRKSLPFLPRTTQYERHPLLQTKSTATGLSEFELLMLEKEALVRRKSVGESSRHRQRGVLQQQQSTTTDERPGAAADRPSSRPALVPRGAHCEPHPLFVRSETGVCELEAYLSEIAGSSTRPSTSSSAPAAAAVKLEPRTSQYERHALFDIRDESGMTGLELLLMERDEERRQQQQDRDGAAATSSSCCPVCSADRSSTAAVRCRCLTNADGGGKNGAQSIDTTTGSGKAANNDVPPGGVESAATTDGQCAVTSSSSSSSSAAAAQQKRVRFVAQRQKTEPEDVAVPGGAAGDASAAGVGGGAAAADGNGGGGEAKLGAGRNSKPTAPSSKNRNCRPDATTSGVSGQRKSCCIS